MLQRARSSKARLIRNSRLTSLYVGDQLQIIEGKLTVGFITGETWQELGPGTFEVHEAACCATSKQATMRNLSPPQAVQAPAAKDGWDALQAGSGQGAALVVRGEEPSEQIPPQVAPIRGETVVTDRPEFSWPIAENAKGYTVRLKAAGSGRVIWKVDCKQNELAYPADQSPLKRNRKYLWDVTPIFEEARFTVPVYYSEFTVDREWDEGELRDLKELADSNEACRVLLAISSYQSYGMERPALAASLRLVKLVPDDADAWQLLAANLRRAGRMAEADEARKKASKLAGADDGP